MTSTTLTLFILTVSIVPTTPCAATSGTTPITATTTTTSAVTTTTAITTTSTASTTTVVTNDCATCTVDQIGIIMGNDGDATPLSALGTDAAGCATLTYTCQRTPPVATDITLITYYTGMQDVGVENGEGTSMVVMNCQDGIWVKDGIEINNVECQIIT